MPDCELVLVPSIPLIHAHCDETTPVALLWQCILLLASVAAGHPYRVRGGPYLKTLGNKDHQLIMSRP